MYQFTVTIHTDDEAEVSTVREVAIGAFIDRLPVLPSVSVAQPIATTATPPAPALALNADELRNLTNYLATTFEDLDGGEYRNICAELGAYGIELPHRRTTKTYRFGINVEVTASAADHAELTSHLSSMLAAVTEDMLSSDGLYDHHVTAELDRVEE